MPNSTSSHKSNYGILVVNRYSSYLSTPSLELVLITGLARSVPVKVSSVLLQNQNSILILKSHQHLSIVHYPTPSISPKGADVTQ